MRALDWLKSGEWSMGNGQCPDCYGVSEAFRGHPRHPTPDTIGHKANCPRAAAIIELGGTPLMRPDGKRLREPWPAPWPPPRPQDEP